MVALGKLLRTTAFKLTLVYLGIFVLFAASLLGYFALNTRRLITDQITATVFNTNSDRPGRVLEPKFCKIDTAIVARPVGEKLLGS